MWFPRFPSDRALRARPVDGPFALSLRQNNAECLYDLNRAAEGAGLRAGMALSEARAFCTGLILRPADLRGDAQMLAALRRWSLRYCPWAVMDGGDGLVLDITGSAHLRGGEPALIADMTDRLARSGLSCCIGLADTRGAAWALAHAGGGIAAPGQVAQHLADLPVALLRIPPDMDTGLQRLGLRRIGDLIAAARGPVARRFGHGLLDQLDRALGILPESVSPDRDPVHYGQRLTLPEPIGLLSDLHAGLLRLLVPLCDKLRAQDMGARALCLTLRRVDRNALDVPLRLAAPMRDPARILPLFVRGMDKIDAGFGIDQLRLVATQVEPMPAMQIGSQAAGDDRLDALITRIGTRIGLDRIHRFHPQDSHIPENGFALVSAESHGAAGTWPTRPMRPLIIFPPEPATAQGNPPHSFRWRRMRFCTGRAYGPERIAPEWWRPDIQHPGIGSHASARSLATQSKADDSPFQHSQRCSSKGDHLRPDPAGFGHAAPGHADCDRAAPVRAVISQGIRDYWRIDTLEGRRLWLFHTPQKPGWFVQGEFL